MELRSSWKTSTKLDDSKSALTILSPDGMFILQAKNSSINFIEKDSSSKMLAVGLNTHESITCIEAISSDPLIFAVGTNEGSLHLFNKDSEIYSIKPLDKYMNQLRVCSYNAGIFTEDVHFLVAQYSPDLVLITIDSLLNRMNNQEAELNIQKWHIHHQFTDCVVVNSQFPSAVVSGIHKFPAVFSIGSSPFLAVSSIVRPAQPRLTENVKKVATRLLRWVTGAEAPKNEEEIPKSLLEWSLKDEGRVGNSISADPTGRWVTICDTFGRIMIVDAVFGHVVKVLKGLRESQIGWADCGGGDPILIIFAPFRRMIIACRVPSGSIIDAVKADEKGMIFQLRSPKHSVGFIDSKGNVVVFDVSPKISERHSETIDKPNYIEFPEFLRAEESPIVSAFRNAKSKEEKLNVLQKVTKTSEAAAVIRAAISVAMDDADLLEVINHLEKIIPPQKFDSKQFWTERETAESQIDYNISYSSMVSVAHIWSDRSKIGPIHVDLSKLKETRITKFAEDKGIIEPTIPAPSVPPLWRFLREPLRCPSIFFSFVSRGGSVEDAFFESSATKAAFIDALIKWMRSANVSELLLGESELTSFFSSGQQSVALQKAAGSLSDAPAEAITGMIAGII